MNQIKIKTTKQTNSIRITEKFAKFLINNRSILIVLISSLFIYFIFSLDNTTHSLTAHDEGLYARRARLILDSGNWFTPFPEPHHKTIGSYWLIALSFKYFGFNETAARIPSALFSSLSAVIIYKIVFKIFSQRAALISSLCLPVMPIWFQYSHYASPDMAFIFFILLSVYFMIQSNLSLRKNEKRYSFYWFYVGIFFSISFFLRSFMLFLPLLGLAPYIYISLSNQHGKSIQYLIIGLIIGLIPTALNLYFSYSFYGPVAFEKLTSFAQDQAFSSKSEFSFISIINSNLYYPLIVFLLSFPVGLISIFGFIRILKNKSFYDKSLLLAFPLINLFILTIVSTKLSHYSLIIFPWVSILCGVSIDSLIQKNNSLSNKFTNFVAYVFLGIGSALLIFILINTTYRLIFRELNNSLILISLLSTSLVYLLSGSLLLKSRNNISLLSISFASIFFAQSFLMTILFNRGIIGSPNKELKLFLKEPSVYEILANHKVYIIDRNLPSKEKTLLEFYLPSWENYTQPLNSIENNIYIITSNSSLSHIEKLKDIKYKKISGFKSFSLLHLF